MKILNVDQIREADAYTIANEPISSIDLMERASAVFSKWFESIFDPESTVHIFCGPGNNGGDGLAIARMLWEGGWNVHVYILDHSIEGSPDYRRNLERLTGAFEVEVSSIVENGHPNFSDNSVLIDALYGSGLDRPLEGATAKLVEYLNSHNNPMVSVDIPSGLYADKASSGTIVQADHTVSFEFPKFAFLFPENEPYVGEWIVKSIHIHPLFLDAVQSKNNLIDFINIRNRTKFSHKGSYGKALLVTGSEGMMGAALLATLACLKSGIGLVTNHIPSGGNFILQGSAPEAMVKLDSNPKHFSYLYSQEELESFDSVGIGSGLGQWEDTSEAILTLIKHNNQPMVIDADALNAISKNPDSLANIPQNSILTPHLKEFDRLAGDSIDSFERHQKQKNFSLNHQVYIILKGAYSCITTPNGESWFNTNGNPGMAKGGSGDVLTGLLTGLLAQGYSPLDTCKTGVHLHGLAGDIAAENKGQESMIARDIIDAFGEAFRAV